MEYSRERRKRDARFPVVSARRNFQERAARTDGKEMQKSRQQKERQCASSNPSSSIAVKPAGESRYYAMKGGSTGRNEDNAEAQRARRDAEETREPMQG